MDASKTKTRFYKDFQIDGFVGIGGTPHATLSLDLVGSVRVSQNVGIGTEPAKRLHIYDPTNSVIMIQSGSSGKSSIEFIRGTTTDNNLDFRLINESSLFRLQYQQVGLVFGADETTYLMDISKTKAQFYDNFQIDGFVGIGTTPSLYKLDVLGGGKFTNGLHITGGSVGIGTTEPSNKLHIQSDTADTRLIIEDMDASAIGLPASIDFIDGGYTSTLVPTTTNELYAYLANDVITASKAIRFTLKQRVIVDLLLVGGGGAGGHHDGGGGGGGGVFYGKDLVMEAGSYVIVVGRGGIGVQGATTQRIADANGNPTITLSLHLLDGDAEATTDMRFYLSEKAAESTYKKIRHIFTKVVKDVDYLAAKADNIEELGQVYNDKLAGNSLRIKFRGEEYLKQDGSTGVRSVIGYPEFAEAIQEGAEYPVVSVTKMTFNPDVDIKKLVKLPDNDFFSAGPANEGLQF
jgi:hypothetical protein